MPVPVRCHYDWTVARTLLESFARTEVIARQGVEEYPERPEDFTRKRAMRVVGYTSGPLLLTFFFAIPIVGPITWTVLNVWSLVALAVGAKLILGDPPMSKIAVILVVGGIPQLALLIGALIMMPRL